MRTSFHTRTSPLLPVGQKSKYTVKLKAEDLGLIPKSLTQSPSRLFVLRPLVFFLKAMSGSRTNTVHSTDLNELSYTVSARGASNILPGKV